MEKLSLGERIRQFREKLNFSQAQLAEKLECSQQKIHKIEKNLQEITVNDAASLFGLGVDLNWLFTGNGEMFRRDRQLKNLENIRQEYNLSDEHLRLVNYLLENPDKREIIVSLAKDFRF